jgi:hypothetical protein
MSYLDRSDHPYTVSLMVCYDLTGRIAVPNRHPVQPMEIFKRSQTIRGWQQNSSPSSELCSLTSYGTCLRSQPILELGVFIKSILSSVVCPSAVCSNQPHNVILSSILSLVLSYAVLAARDKYIYSSVHWRGTGDPTHIIAQKRRISPRYHPSSYLSCFKHHYCGCLPISAMLLCYQNLLGVRNAGTSTHKKVCISL